MPKLLYFISEDWFFWSHFFDRAKAAQLAGYEVVVLTRLGRHGDALREAGFRVIGLRMDRSSTNPLRELGVLRQVWRAYRAESPDLLHHVALKPILYGSLIARWLGFKAVVNAPVGMGYVFTERGSRGRFLRWCVHLALRMLLNPRGSKVVFENREDLGASVAVGSVRAQDAVLIQGAGVDTEMFCPQVSAEGEPLVVLGARMLRDKGVFEFVEAARLLKGRGVAVRCVLVGAPDLANPTSVTTQQMADWQARGIVECWGHRDDMADVLRGSHIACLPSYREGLPKFLLEAMACGLAVVSTDVPGCREAVRHGETGLLVPAGDASALAAALEHLLCHSAVREAMGRRGRALACNVFAVPLITRLTMDLYRSFRRS
jgi:glycosyltransferase involved in cell wall biosynthesis